jgi:2-polyprenyl-3-methyl-5-hydroxy-6-metoxy-1,4-benzoquinol methylase
MSYSSRLLEQGSFLTRLAHRRRYDKTLDLVAELRGATLLDYGCGDGLLLKRALERHLMVRGVGVDSSAAMRRLARSVLTGISGVSVIAPDELPRHLPPASCDVVLCCETLEHASRPSDILDLLRTYVAPAGRVIITVPVEVGPALLGKQVGRFLASCISRYRYEHYKTSELLAAALLWKTAGSDEERGHKGFDYRTVERLVRERFTITRTVFSPFPRLGPLANSTIMWLCKLRW